jgi:hypothetical protein
MLRASHIFGLLLVTTWAGWTEPAGAQLPLPPRADSIPRLPDDQIEGAIWQFKATKRGEEKPIEARFRVSEGAILEVPAVPEAKPGDGKTPPERVKEALEKLGPKVADKRIGDVEKMEKGKTKLVFLEGPLRGQAIVSPVKDKKNVWFGEYRQRTDPANEKLGPIWKLELRQAED